ncbi:MAG TPA: signal peptidase II [Actinobacteria bacterium]|nr:signal peptidase II [Actinomycetota bacterium]
MIFWITALVALAADQLTKLMIRQSLSAGQSIPVFNKYFHITFVRNPGGAFGIFPVGKSFFLVIAIFVVIGIIIYKLTHPGIGRMANLAMGLVLGGAAGNLVDRLFIGEVVDWIDFRIWPVFNIADIVLVVGLSLFSLYIIRSS